MIFYLFALVRLYTYTSKLKINISEDHLLGFNSLNSVATNITILLSYMITVTSHS